MKIDQLYPNKEFDVHLTKMNKKSGCFLISLDDRKGSRKNVHLDLNQVMSFVIHNYWKELLSYLKVSKKEFEKLVVIKNI